MVYSGWGVKKLLPVSVVIASAVVASRMAKTNRRKKFWIFMTTTP